jgi:hypothetical protein
MDMTKLDPGDSALHVEFRRQPRQNEAKSAEAGRPIFEDVEYITILTAGDKTSVIDRPATEGDKQRFHKKYEAFSKGKEQASLDGTPLSEWPGVTRSQVMELEHFGCRTVDRLAAMSDDVIHRLGAGYLARRQAARAYLDQAAARAPMEQMQEQLSERDRLIASQSAQLQSMAEAIARLEARGQRNVEDEGDPDGPEGQEEPPPIPRRRGRPPKNMRY